MKSRDLRSMGTTCSVCPWSAGFSLCQELMRRSSESFRRRLILWRTLPTYRGLQKKSCWLPVWVPSVLKLYLNKRISRVPTFLRSIFFIFECLFFCFVRTQPTFQKERAHLPWDFPTRQYFKVKHELCSFTAAMFHPIITFHSKINFSPHCA